jgi:hypothetical protein
MPSEVDGVASSRGISAPPATAIASNSAATKRSFRLMFLPSPADNFSKELSAGGEIGLSSRGSS